MELLKGPSHSVIAVLIVTIAILSGRSTADSTALKTSVLGLGTEDRLAVLTPADELIHVALLFRHTVRAPRAFPKGDPILKPGLFPRGIERSTRRGLEATRNVSRIWKSWYKDFLTGDPNEVFARSSQADRCYETLAMALDVMYPSPDDLPLSQVAIRMPPKGTDKYVENCGNMQYITRDYDPKMSVPEDIFKEEGFRTVGDYVDFLRRMTGQVNESVNFFYMAYMEGFVSVDFEQKFTRNDHWMLKYPKTREFSRLYLLHNSVGVIGPYFGHYLMNGIGDQLQAAAEGKSTFKLSLFAFHDLSLLAVLRAFGVNGKPTQPLSAVAFELRRHRNEFRVAVRMSEGLSTDWVYPEAEYIPVRNDAGEQVTDLDSVLGVMRNFYKDKIDIGNCGYFGDDAKV